MHLYLIIMGTPTLVAAFDFSQNLFDKLSNCHIKFTIILFQLWQFREFNTEVGYLSEQVTISRNFVAVTRRSSSTFVESKIY